MLNTVRLYKKILFTTLLTTNIIFGQFILPRANTIFVVDSLYNKSYTLNQSVIDSISVTVNRNSKYIDTITSSGVTLQSNIEQLSSSNRWITNLGDWTVSGDMTATRQSDSSVLLNNIPVELNPTPSMIGTWTTLYQSDFSSTEDLSETDGTGSANNDNVSDGTTSYNNVYKYYANSTSSSSHRTGATFGQVSGDLCRLSGNFYIPNTNTHTNGFLISSSFNSTTVISGTYNFYQEPYSANIGQWKNFNLLIAFDNNYFTRLTTAANGTSTYSGSNLSTDDILYLYNIKMEKQVLPTGWTASNAPTKTNYILNQANGIQFVSDGTSIPLTSGNILTIGHTYKYTITATITSNGIKFDASGGNPSDITITTTGTHTGTFVADGTTVILNRNSGAANATVTYLSITEVKDEGEFRLPITTEVNKKYKLKVNYKEAQSSFYNSDFSSSTDGFTSTRSTVSGNSDNISDGTTSYDDVFKIYADGSNSTHYFTKNNVLNTLNDLHLVTFDIYIPTANTNVDGIWIGNAGSTGSAYSTISSVTSKKIVDGTNFGTISGREIRSIKGAWAHIQFQMKSFSYNQFAIGMMKATAVTFTGANSSSNDIVYIKNLKVYDIVEGQSFLSSKLHFDYGNISDSTNTLSLTSQTYSMDFWGQGVDSLKFNLSGESKANIKNISLQEITTKKVVKRGDTTKVYFTPNTASVGNKTATITLNGNKTVEFDYDVIYPPQVLARNDSLIFNNYEEINSLATATLIFDNPSEEDLFVIPDYTYNSIAPFYDAGSNYFAAAHDSASLTFALNPVKDTTYSVAVRFVVVELDYTHIDTIDIIFYADVNVSGTNYYVSASGLYANDGLSSATPINLAKLEDLTLSGGDTVKFDANSYFDFPNLVLNSDGSSGNEIVLTSYNGTAVMNGGVNLEHYEYVEDLIGTSIDTIQSSLANTTMGNIGGEYYIGWRLNLTPGLLTKYLIRSTEKIPANIQVKLYEKSGTSFVPVTNTESNVNANLTTGINTFTLKTPFTISTTKNYFVTLVGKEGLSGIPVPIGSVSGSDTTYFIKTNSQAWNSAESEATFSTITTPTIASRINYAVGVEIQTSSGSGNGTIWKTTLADVADVRLNGSEGVLGESVVYDSLVNVNRYNITGSDINVLTDTLSNIAIKKGFAIKVNGDNYKIQNLYLVRLDSALVLNGRNITVEDVYFQNCKNGLVINNNSVIQRNTFVANKTNIINDTTDFIANVIVNSGLHNNSAIKVNSGNVDLFHNSFNQTLTSGKAQIEGNIDSLVNNAIYSSSDYYIYSTSITKALNNAYAGTSIWKYNSVDYLSGYSFASASGSIGSVIGSSFDYTSLYNLYPLETSSLIDAGIPSYITKDFDNKDIPYVVDISGQTDIGAYEYQGSIQLPTEEILGDYLTESQYDYFVSPTGVASFENATSSTNPMSLTTLINNKSSIPSGSVIGVKNGVYQYNWNTSTNPDVSAFTFDNFPSNVVFKRFGNGESRFTTLESLPGNISANWSKTASESITYDVWKINPAALYTYGSNIGLGRVWFVISGDTLEYPRFMTWRTSTLANITVDKGAPSIIETGGASDSLFSPTQTNSTARSMYRWTTYQPNTMTTNSGGFYVWTGTEDKPSAFYDDILVTGTAMTGVTFSNTTGLKLDGLTFEGGDFETLKLLDCDDVELYNVRTKKNGYTAVTVQSCDGVEISYSNFNSDFDNIAGGGRIYYEYYSAQIGLNFTFGTSNVNVHHNNILDQTSMPFDIHAYNPPPQNIEFHDNVAGATRKGHLNYMRGFHINQVFVGDPNKDVSENEYRPRNVKIYNNLFRYVTREEKVGAIGMYIYFNIFEDGYQTVDSLFHHMAWRPNDVTADVMSALDTLIYYADAEWAYFNNTFINWGATIANPDVKWRRDNPEYWYNNAFINVGYQNPNYYNYYTKNTFFFARKGDLPLYFRNNFIWSQYVTTASTTDWFYYGDPGNSANYKTLTEIQAQASSSDIISGNLEMDKSTYSINNFVNRLNHYNASSFLQGKGYSDTKILGLLGNNFYDRFGNQVTNSSGQLIKTLNIGAVNN